MKKSIFTEKEYMITAGINLLSLIFWFMPVINLGYLVEKDYTLGQLVKNLNEPILDLFKILYIVMLILGTVTAALPLLKKFSGVAAIPDIKDGLFINMQGAPAVHAIIVLFCYVICGNEGRVEVSLCFAGIMAILLGIGSFVLQGVMKSKYKKNKKALANAQRTNNSI